MRLSEPRSVSLFLLSVVVALTAFPSTLRAFDGGDGSPGDPYQISTCQQLQEVGYAENLASDFVLTGDIDCSGFGTIDPGGHSGFSPIGSAGTPFSGVFDGDGFGISNVSIVNYSSYVGLFARTNGATITDVGIQGASLNLYGLPYGGFLVGEAVDTDISGSYASGSMDDNAPTSFHIDRVTNGVGVEVYVEPFKTRFGTKEFRFSGIEGELTLDIYQSGLIPFAGIDGMELHACGQVVPLSSAVQVLTGADVLVDVASVDLNVVGVHERPVRATWSVPGECGMAVLSLNANEYGHSAPFIYPRAGAVSYAMDSVTGALTIDGLIPESDGRTPLFVPHWYPATGHPEGDVFVYVSNDDDYLYIAADVTIDNTDDEGQDWISVTAGGREFRVSDADRTYGTCAFGLTSKVPYKHNTCELRIPRSELSDSATVQLVLGYYGTAGESYWGGLVGYLSGSSTVDQSYAYTTVSIDDTGSAARVGGFAGYTGSLTSVTDSYARGTIDHDDFGGYQAGFVALSDGDLTNVYSAAAVTGTQPGTNGGLTASHAEEAVNSYWDTEVSGQATSSTGEGRTTAEMKTQSTFVDWDFDDIWGIEEGVNDGYPKFGPVMMSSGGGGRRSGGQISQARRNELARELGLVPGVPAPSSGELPEGSLIRADGDEDVFIVNGQGFKRLFLNEVIFSFYGHLGGWSSVRTVTPQVRDAYITSGYFRNCETDEQSVYALEVTGDDAGILHHVDVSGADAVAADADFFRKVFCINTNEFDWYPKGVPYTSLL